MQFQLQTIRNPHISRSGRCRISYVCVDNLSRVYFLIFQKCIMFPCPSARDASQIITLASETLFLLGQKPGLCILLDLSITAATWNMLDSSRK